MNKSFGVFMCSALMIFSLSACNKDNANSASEDVTVQENGHADQSDDEIGSVSDTHSEQNESESIPEDGAVPTEFTVDFFGEAAGNPRSFSLNLPASWTSEPSGVYDQNGAWIASMELHPVTDAAQPFADIDILYSDAVSTNEFVVSGYPAKSYILELGMDGSPDITRRQYLYYIMIDDDAYVLLFFSPEGLSETVEADFEEIVSSFAL